MKLRETYRSSFKSLARNKLRSILTMLGVIIGIFSVTMLTSIGEGVKRQVVEQVESIGSNLLYAVPGKVQVGLATPKESKLGIETGKHAKTSFTYDDVLALKEKDHIEAVSGVYNSVARLEELDLNVTITGVDEDYDTIRNLDIKYGRFISDEERIESARVAILGHQANKEIYKNTGDNTGKTFRMNDQDYTVIGVLPYKKPESFGPRTEDLNVKIFVPVTEILTRTESKTIPEIIVKASSSSTVNKAENTVTTILRGRHPDGEFTVLKQQDILNMVGNIIGILTAGLGGIAAISLIVGGIGIMNIMLVSVAERTREIGVRKAIGAKNRDILIQFLIEAIVLSVIGGALGVLAGYGGSRLLPELTPAIKTALSVPAIVISLVFALLVGIFFGVYPAAKAARLDPIVALRNE